MDYIELRCIPVLGHHINELLIALLDDMGFESFTENDDGSLSAFIKITDYSANIRNNLGEAPFSELIQSFEIQQIADQNWNAVWESQYEPVVIDGRCSVRAPFHAKPAGVEFDIVIMPKMSFGTAHHETTKLMIRYVDRMELKGKSLLDMGSGTGVLAILARKKGADPVTAIDNDTWAFENAKENIVLNDVPDIEVLQGDSGLLSNRKFDIILANINRNILLNDMEAYNSSLNADGKLIMSGFYLDDLQIITEKAAEMGLKLDSQLVENNWTSACFLKDSWTLRVGRNSKYF